MSVIGDARARFVAERPTFVELASAVEEAVSRRARSAGIACSVSGRAKEVSSFVGKSLRKGYVDPWAQITDKVGVRVTLDDPSDIGRVVEFIKNDYEVVEFQDKTRTLWEDDKIGYGGVHLQVVIPNGDTVGGECEIQVRSAAQNLWSEMSHRLLYKPGVEPDEDTKRALTRLAALMEIFDEEVSRRVNQMTAAPGYQIEELINLAESEFYRFSDTTYDRPLSRYVISEIGPTLPTENTHQYATQLRAFVAANEGKLTGIFRRYADIDTAVLLHQPESMIIFERIAGDPFMLREVWERQLPLDELEQLQAIWGD
jgi:ppGpp synthetase/RelA/SpoT-type nucleotidyltranferase